MRGMLVSLRAIILAGVFHSVDAHAPILFKKAQVLHSTKIEFRMEYFEGKAFHAKTQIRAQVRQLKIYCPHLLKQSHRICTTFCSDFKCFVRFYVGNLVFWLNAVHQSWISKRKLSANIIQIIRAYQTPLKFSLHCNQSHRLHTDKSFST